MSHAGPPPERRKRQRSDMKTSDVTNNANETEPRDVSKYMTRSQTKRLGIKFDMEQPPAKRVVRKHINHRLYLEDMNADCLLHIMEYLQPFDLAKVAVMCKRFYNLAQYQFEIKYQKIEYKSLCADGLLVFDVAERIFRIFGHHIKILKMDDIYIAYEHNQFNHLELVSRYCTSLISLSINNMCIDGALSTKLTQLFERVQILDIHCSSIDIKWESLKNLIALQLYRVFWKNWAPIALPKLKMLFLISVNRIGFESLEGFLKVNLSLTGLAIINCNGISTKLFGTIGQMLKLDLLDFQQNDQVSSEPFQADLAKLSSLHELERLSLNCNKHSVSHLLESFMKNGVGLRYLQLNNGPIDEKTYECVKNMEEIRVLKFNNVTEIDNRMIIDFAKGLQLLERFYLITTGDHFITPNGISMMVDEAGRLSKLGIDVPGFKLDPHTYERVLNSVKSCHENRKLRVEVLSDGEDLLIPNEVMNGSNKQWLHVRVHDRKSFNLLPNRGNEYRPFHLALNPSFFKTIQKKI